MLTFENLITRLLKLNNNSLTILSKLTQSLVTSDDYVDVEVWDSNLNTKNTYRIPSYSALKNKVEGIENSYKLLTDANTNIPTETTDTNLKKLKLIEPDIPDSLTINDKITVQTNNFLKNLVDIDTFATIDLNKKVSDSCKEIEVVEFIFNEECVSANEKFLHSSYITDSSNNYDQLILLLANNKVDYNIDKYTYEFNPSILSASANFLVVDLSVPENETNTTSTNSFSQWVKFNKTYYNYKSSDSDTNSITKQLAVDDILCKDKQYYYKITKITQSEDYYYVLLETCFSSEPKILSGDILKIVSTPIMNKTLKVHMSPFIEKIVFIRELTPVLNLTSQTFSPGVHINPNNLSVTDKDGTILTFKDYFLKYVYEFGEIFDSYKIDSKITSKYAIVPDPPTLSQDNFSVVNINSHLSSLTSDTLSDEIKNLIKELDYYISERNSLTDILNSYKTKRDTLISNGTPETDSQILQIDNNITSIQKEIDSTNTIITTKNSQLTQLDPNIDTTIFDPKFKILGIWSIPSPKVDLKGRNQDIVRFDIQYRYLSLSGSKTFLNNVNYTNTDGDNINFTFSDWNTVQGSLRKKILDDNGNYVWEYTSEVAKSSTDEDPFNTCLISISPYEKVEIRIRSITEAGYPETIISSDWSTSIMVEFPTNFYTIANYSASDLASSSSVSVVSTAVSNVADQVKTNTTDISDIKKKITALTSNAEISSDFSQLFNKTLNLSFNDSIKNAIDSGKERLIDFNMSPANLTNYDIINIETTNKLVNLDYLFEFCTAKTISISSMPNIVSCIDTFKNTPFLTKVTLPKETSSLLVNMKGMFYSNSKDHPIYIEQIENIENLGSISEGCDLTNFINFATDLDSIINLNCNINRVDITNSGVTGLRLFNKNSLFNGDEPQINIINNQLNENALNNLFSDLPEIEGKKIVITGNPGASICDATIAENKGWTVIK